MCFSPLKTLGGAGMFLEPGSESSKENTSGQGQGVYHLVHTICFWCVFSPLKTLVGAGMFLEPGSESSKENTSGQGQCVYHLVVYHLVHTICFWCVFFSIENPGGCWDVLGARIGKFQRNHQRPRTGCIPIVFFFLV